MLLPKHKLDQLDYYVIENGVKVGERCIRDTWEKSVYIGEYISRVRLYWKRKKFLGIFPYGHKVSTLRFEMNGEPQGNGQWIFLADNEFVELKMQLDEWSAA